VALTAHVALLRAVNVGGRTAVMAELREMAADLDLETPRTLLQSGNLVFESKATGAELEARLEDAFAARFGFAADFMVRTAAEWADVLAANPFPRMAKDDPSHLVVMALKARPDPAAVEALRAWIPGRETLAAIGRELYIAYPDGIGPSKLTNVAIERRLGARGTARNWNTATKLAAMLGG
jgi:uncharacterized protein (DUF1697 family)